MKFLISIAILIISNFSFANECAFDSDLDNISIFQCNDAQNTENLYNKDGSEIKVLKKIDNKYFVKKDDVKNISEVSSIKIIYRSETHEQLAKLNPFNSSYIKFYLSAFSYNYFNQQADINNTTVDFDNEKTRTLPTGMTIEYSDKDLVLLLSPDFAEDAGSISILKNTESGIQIGGYLHYNSTSDTIATTSITEERNKTMEGGLFTRLITNTRNWEILSTAQIGYMKIVEEEIKSGTSTKAYIHGFIGAISSHFYYKVNPRFLLGTGIRAGYGKGSLNDEGEKRKGELYIFDFDAIALQLVF